MAFRKIINDPVYGFITIDDPLIFKVIAHPYYQRLRRIKQMALAYLVYPGAVHTRLHHSLGAYHLMSLALQELKSKGIAITAQEEQGAKIAILLHDIGHGPFSHALESVLMENMHHEELSLLIMQSLNDEMEGALQTAIDIFTHQYPKRFLHQLVSGQLDVDRMDYLTRDSFFTGVSEGVIGYDRIIKMLTVNNGELMVEEKAIFSIEKFLVARRLMYWQVYLHKTVLSSEMMLVKALQRAKFLLQQAPDSLPDNLLTRFLLNKIPEDSQEQLKWFCQLDDFDVVYAIKIWAEHSDKVLSTLCKCLKDRQLFKLRLQGEPIEAEELNSKRQELISRLGLTEEESAWLAFTGVAQNLTYDPRDESIQILFKDGSIRDISGVDNALIQYNLSRPIKKFYICHFKFQ
jgi:uncharacterized protein